MSGGLKGRTTTACGNAPGSLRCRDQALKGRHKLAHGLDKLRILVWRMFRPYRA